MSVREQPVNENAKFRKGFWPMHCIIFYILSTLTIRHSFSENLLIRYTDKKRSLWDKSQNNYAEGKKLSNKEYVFSLKHTAFLTVQILKIVSTC